jgi:hypothetical protein
MPPEYEVLVFHRDPYQAAVLRPWADLNNTSLNFGVTTEISAPASIEVAVVDKPFFTPFEKN